MRAVFVGGISSVSGEPCNKRRGIKRTVIDEASLVSCVDVQAG